MKKTKLILLQLFIAFVLISTSVYATVNTTIALSLNEATAFRGDTVEVTLSLKDVEEDKKIQSVAGYINYDENVIEAITVDNIKKSDDDKITNIPQIYKSTLAYEAARSYAVKNQITIYNATRGGNLEVFKRINFDDVIANNK